MLRRRLRLAAFLACTLLAGLVRPAVAAEPAATAIPPDRLVLSRMGLPIVWHGRVVNYVFVETRLKLAPGRTVEPLRAKEPYLRDALIRAGGRAPFVDPTDLTRVDERALKAVLLREATRILGPGVVVAAEVKAQEPRRRTGLPRTASQVTAPERPIVP